MILKGWRAFLRVFLVACVFCITCVRSSSRSKTTVVVNKEVLMIAGNFSINGHQYNVAMYENGKWSGMGDVELHSYSEKVGIVRDIAIDYR